MTVRTAMVALSVLAVGVACGGGGDGFPEWDPPVGTPVLPDLMPKPQLNVTTDRVDGRWYIHFSTIIVNVGKSDFVLRARQDAGGAWRVEQGVPHSGGGLKAVPTDATLVWGGDGHDHWHVKRVARVRLVPLDEGARAVDAASRFDSKIGFCFYDHTRELSRGPEEAVFSSHSCGDDDSTSIGVGLSPGWNDTYRQSLPGQRIDVTGLADGRYRLWTQVDEQGWFREANVDNNRTYIDIELEMLPQGLAAPTVATGPAPG